MLKKPVCILTADNKPLNALIVARIISVDVTDNRADEADQLDITLDDHDGQLELPKRGVKINCQLGFAGETLVDKGDFIVDEVEWTGTPDQLIVKASSANFKSSLKSGKSRSFHRQTLGQIAGQVARDHTLQLVITADLADISLVHIDQTNESDMNLLRRLAKQNGAEMNIKKGRLLIFKTGSGKTASGKQMPAITITRATGDKFRYSESDRDSDYTGVSAHYQDQGKATRKRVTAGETEQYGGGDDKRTKTKSLKGTFASKEAAERAATAEMERVKRSSVNFSITLAIGRPDIGTESPVQLQGFKGEVDKLGWVVKKATHRYSNGGLVSEVEMEGSI